MTVQCGREFFGHRHLLLGKRGNKYLLLDFWAELKCMITAANRYIQFCQDFTVASGVDILNLYFRLRFPTGNWSKWNKISTTVHN